MSAIAGIYNISEEPVSREHSLGMMKALQKFPADDVQIWQKQNIFLGCHAQWITPESVGEQLPYYDYERQLSITADAIIDNRLELFQKLQIDEDEGEIIPDSQLILLAYYKWGKETPKHLIGDFAFMIWDEKRKRLFGARDFSGARTLYFFHKNQRFAFCTVMQPLLALPYIEKCINEQWLAEYLAIPNMIDVVDSSITVIENIQQVPPSHSISVEDGKIIISKYNTLISVKDVSYKKDEDYVEAFKEVFQTAVNSRLRTFHSVGTQLSGGLDSGAVTSFAAKSLQKVNKQLYTYSYIPENDFIDWTPSHRMADEQDYIKSTVKYAGNIEDHYLRFEGRSSISEIDEWLEIMEMPYKFFENSLWLKGIYAEAKHQGIGVLLNGARGNFSISWGPALDYYGLLLKKMKWPRLRDELQRYSLKTGITNKSRLLSVIGKKAFPLMNRLGQPQEVYQLPMLINPEFAKEYKVFNKLQQNGIDMDGASKYNIYEIRKRHFEKEFMWNSTGTSGTKLSLRYGVWNRDPTNDIRVIRFCLSLPEDQFVKDGLDRALIRRATEGFLPDRVRLNQKVRGIQGADWIHRSTPSWDSFLEELKQLVKDPIVSNFLNIEMLETAIPKVQEGPRPEYAFDPELRVLMRALIVYRFLKSFYLEGGDIYAKRMAKTNVGSVRH
ncbi:lasso peptide isopeptide bond-forming cyclase [Virgibacillus salinus]|uniref:asparagine synthase (glutamine-hydrolyzing) n=1 Tax=Virgibacillus salinus TaxID=553311 RepID=A0A1H0Y4P3_9BACI|nr:lasso peptide isopeptide bond-forming cyclase [Virgibacillus salinus]SDQ10154.1 asparagine synthase (glutamine-hydrolysing) [Virgibacillus salinus]